MKSIFEQMGGTYRQEGDYLIPNLSLPDESEYQIGKYGRMRRSYGSQNWSVTPVWCSKSRQKAKSAKHWLPRKRNCQYTM